ncbi:GNAT family N-acetyltransferase [Streptomyces sp. CNS654]|uniref:GNAT family N-acetyltransferase n=1 Tax=Streptomyces sp. CNS654 TaxID=1506995 RepID=UPI00067BCCD6|nr:GNAT family N-acetyltransferase [Streptomyces sp. CNS654]
MGHQTDPPPEEAPGCRVRWREGSDLDACVQVLADVHECDGYPEEWPERPGEWLARPSLCAAWVAELDGKIVGHVGLTRGGAEDRAPGLWSRRTGVPIEKTAVISRLFVSPAARGHGAGALLMERATWEARLRGLHPVLDVLTSDTSAVALYERLGWTWLATVDQRWGPDRTVAVHCYAAPVTPGPARGPCGT